MRPFDVQFISDNYCAERKQRNRTSNQGASRGRVTQGGFPPRVLTDPDLPVEASGSSSHDFATLPTMP